MKEVTGISIAAIQKLLDQLIQKKYVERGEKDGSWRDVCGAVRCIVM
jgi:DNA-binding IclR family transcriptional regulator